MEYNIGDEVKVIWTNEDDNEISRVYNGDIGIIADIEPHIDNPLYIVSFNDDKKRWYCYKSQIELVDPPVKRTERGWAGHFICANHCLFRRNTLLEYKDKKWVVSSVGGYVNPVTKTIEAIGIDRWYETMCFDAIKKDGYIDTNIDIEHHPNEIGFEWGLFAKTIDELYEKHPAPDNNANDIHEKWVEWAMEEIKKED